jgi:Tfp pilus assembly protein PilF
MNRGGFAFCSLLLSFQCSTYVFGQFGSPLLGNGASLRSSYIVLAGKVVTEDGSPPPEPAALETDCGGVRRIQAYTEADGGFTFTLNAPGMVDYSQTNPADQTGGGSRLTLQGCDMTVVEAGYRSPVFHLSGVANTGQTNVGRLILSRNVTQPSDPSVSVSSLEAPKAAQKEFQKGSQEEVKQHWAAAAQRFQKAVTLYSKYAVAWLQLGLMQAKQGDNGSARQSYAAALSADPKYLEPYGKIAILDIQQSQWKDLADTTDRLLAIEPMGFPQFWFLNSVANYNLQKFDQAEKSDSRALALDQAHRFPRSEYLMAMIRAVRHDYGAAANYLRQYIQHAPNAQDAEKVKQQLAELEKLSNPVIAVRHN